VPENRFQRCLDFLRSPGIEGGFSNNSSDHGGATNFGISTPIFEAARSRGLVPDSVTSVRDLTPAQAENIYFYLFWADTRAGEFPVPLDLCAFDAFVQHRPVAAVRLIQRAVDAIPDGVIGPETIERARTCSLRVAVEKYCWAREQLYREIAKTDPTQQVFLHGWLNRVSHIRSAALADIS
jgi:lysozyme family protein